MNFASMEYFTVLAQERSFTRAAERLHITQQSLSSHVAGMERELGCRLLVRHIPLELTYAGEVLLRYAAEFQEAHGDMRREFCDISQNQRGVLRVGVAAARGRALLPGTIALFQRDFPNITLALTEGSNDALRQKLAEGSVDLAVADFPDALPDVSLRDFYREAVVLLIEPALFAAVYGERAQACRQAFLAGDFSALGDCPLLLGGEEDVDGRAGRAVLRRAGVERPKIRAVSHNVGMLLALCAQGIGACFCPENLARTAPAARAEPLLTFRLGADAEYPIRFGWQARSYQWSVISAFMDCAERAAKTAFSAGAGSE